MSPRPFYLKRQYADRNRMISRLEDYASNYADESKYYFGDDFIPDYEDLYDKTLTKGLALIEQVYPTYSQVKIRELVKEATRKIYENKLHQHLEEYLYEEIEQYDPPMLFEEEPSDKAKREALYNSVRAFTYGNFFNFKELDKFEKATLDEALIINEDLDFPCPKEVVEEVSEQCAQWAWNRMRK
jgi:hypothetical protein